MSRLPVRALRLYRALAKAFPHEFRNVYGKELMDTAEDAVEPVWRRHGLRGLARLLMDLAVRIPIEYAAEFRKDCFHASRMLARSPGFTAVSLASLALGMCVATCAFSYMNGMVLRDVPMVQRPAELVALQMPVSYPDYRRYREQAVFSSAAAYLAPTVFAVSSGGRTERTWGHLVTSSYFSTLGVQPALGNFFTPDQDRPGVSPVLVASYRFWQERLGSDPAAVGKALRINGQAATLIGVGPPGFLGASPVLYAADLWMPLSVGERVAPELAGITFERHDRAIFRVIARRKPGVTLTRAEAAADTVARKIEQDYGDPDRNRPGRRVALLEGGKLFQFRKQDLPFFTSFFTLIAGLMVLIPCANGANMMLARATARRREIAVRLALGASRARLIRQLLTESMMVAAAAGILGFLGCVWVMRSLSQVRMPFSIPVNYDFQPDGHVLLLALGLVAVTGLAFGLAPALHATRTDLAPALKEGGAVWLGRNRRLSLRNLLVVSQVAGTLTLLTVLGMQSFGIQTMMGVQEGFNLKNLYLVSLDPVRDGLSGEESRAFLGKLLDRVKRLPSVTAASLTETVPVSMPGNPLRMSRAGAGGPRIPVTVLQHVVGRDYFDVTGIPILRGRGFRREDEAAGAGTVILSEALARALWGAEDPIGRLIETEASRPSAPFPTLPWAVDDRPGALDNGRRVFEVVGVARDTVEGLVVQKPRPTVYFPLSPADYRRPQLSGITLIVRAVPGVDVLSAVRREVAAMDARAALFAGRSMSQHIEQFMAPLRMAAGTYNLLWVFGLVLATVGLAGVTAYSVTQRGREIAIRVALGARSGNVLRVVMKDGVALVAIGMALGLPGAWAASRLIAAMNSSVGQVSSTSASNPMVLFGAPFLLAAVALAACYVPARKSLRIDPVETLRQE